MTSWDTSVDFLVVGSGAAGMTAALRAHDLGGETLVIEKAAVFGGSTAVSGGVVWVPNNPLMARQGIRDSPAAALRYLEIRHQRQLVAENDCRCTSRRRRA